MVSGEFRNRTEVDEPLPALLVRISINLQVARFMSSLFDGVACTSMSTNMIAYDALQTRYDLEEK